LDLKTLVNIYLKIKHVIFVLLLLPLFWFGIKGGWNQVTSDFPNYYVSAKLLLHGQLNDAYQVEKFNQHIQKYNSNAQGLFVMYPPTTSLIMLPLTLFDMLNAKRIWIIISLIASAGISYLLSKICLISVIDAANILLICGFNMYNDIMLGQVYLVMLFVVLLGWHLLMQQKNIISGISLGIVAAIKFLPLFYLPFLWYKKYFKICFILIFVCALFHVICFWLVGTHVYQNFLEVFTANYLDGKVANEIPNSLQYQSFEVFSNQLSPKFSSSEGTITLIKVSWKVFWTLLAALLSIKYLKSTSFLFVTIASTTLLLLLFENGSATYHLLFALLTVITFLKENKSKTYFVFLMISLAAMGFLPTLVNVLSLDNFMISFTRLWCLCLYSLCFFIGLLLQGNTNKQQIRFYS
jgi:hypothetical protein